MIQRWYTHSIFIFLISAVILGFSFTQKVKNNDNPPVSRNQSAQKNTNQYSPDDSGPQNQISGTSYYTDNFDGANDTTSLKSRGYKVYYRGSGTQGTSSTWFQGGLFPAFNGPSTGYVAGNFQVATALNNIDNWLVLPGKTVMTGDSLIFYARSESGSAFPDSIRVMYSAAGDSIPEALWIELGRFKTNTTAWERKSFGANLSGVKARFAIRYNIVNSGPGGTNGNYIGIDALTIEAPVILNDIEALSINSPPANLTLPASTIAPKATFKNVGIRTLNDIPVSIRIAGPVNYTSSQIIRSLNAGESTQVTFDSTFNVLPGNYTVAAYSELLNDGNRNNDTVKLSVSAANPNYGTSGGYFYANSTNEASPAPTKPQFCWKDTAGSVSLAVNTLNLQPDITTGDLDDGYWKILLPSGKKVRFFGNDYDTVRIGTNGIIGFQSFIPNQSNWEPPSAGIPGGTVLNAVYPLWADFDFSDNIATATSRISYKVSGNLLIITYDRAPVYSGDPGDYVSFQIAIDVSPSPSINSRILFQYAGFAGGQTGSVFINKVNSNNFSKHLIGLQNAGGTSAFTYRFRNASSIITTGSIFNSSSGSLALQIGPDANQLNNSCFTLNLTTRLQAVQLQRKDTLSVSIRQNVSPFAIIETKKVVYDSVTGTASVPLNLIQNGTSYYIYVTHRNSLPTWSALPILCTANTLTYDFTTDVSKAFGNNMILAGGKASFYTGDVTRDNCINLSDIIRIFNDANIFLSGYVASDLNYDGTVNLTDILFAYNNSLKFVCEISPPGVIDNSFESTMAEFNYAKDFVPELKMSKKEWIERFGK